MLRSNRTIFVGIVLLLVGIWLPTLVKILRDFGAFGGAWGGLGPFVIAIKVRPWIIGCGALAVAVGVLERRKQISN